LGGSLFLKKNGRGAHFFSKEMVMRRIALPWQRLTGGFLIIMLLGLSLQGCAGLLQERLFPGTTLVWGLCLVP
jgi:hypothetical protein